MQEGPGLSVQGSGVLGCEGLGVLGQPHLVLDPRLAHVAEQRDGDHDGEEEDVRVAHELGVQRQGHQLEVGDGQDDDQARHCAGEHHAGHPRGHLEQRVFSVPKQLVNRPNSWFTVKIDFSWTTSNFADNLRTLQEI